MNRDPAETALTQLVKNLMARPSVTPTDQGCQNYLAERLSACGFELKKLPAGNVENLWAVHGHTAPCLAFAGHTDVVPAGNQDAWNTPPFIPTIVDGHLYGRGAADMKGSLGAMVLACEDFVRDNPHHPGQVALLITSGEEGDDYADGTPHVMEHLAQQQQTIEYCVVGEPSSSQRVADTIRIGRRGSLSGILTVQGQPGHVAYPEHVKNPIHQISQILAKLSTTKWDEGNAFFPPTSFQTTRIQAENGASNVVPSSAQCQFNFRYSSVLDHKTIQQQVHQIIQDITHQYSIDFTLSGEPFITTRQTLIQSVSNAIEAELGYRPTLSTSGGTSDGRFIAPYDVEVVELGPCNATIHQSNECVSLQDLQHLYHIYRGIIARLLS